ncbi:hypothetical protein [Streptomyces sp. NL15-2K]|uniref:hypothetical protein n=1 Tax=Streptomyces sp. NL15-2K TaxID=376149 RepID=UPI000FFAC19B|nr:MULTISPECIES: hypothetical protein [Actinomycetes]WKX14266.1 hypothetical protein Q4V64_44835 [Kutzneria buriramensis]GCB53149.1 hypothetical protein SNL152K_10506 [Streptomyces sp. NL15-2K]
MKRRFFRRCGHAPGALSLEDQAAVDQFRALLAALRDPNPWTPAQTQDLAVRVGPFVERAHPRPGDDHGPDIIAVALQHPGGSYTPYGERYRKLGWLRCETTTILGAWNPAYAPLTHAEAGLDLPDDVGMTPAHYGVHVEGRRSDGTGYTLLRIGPYFQTWLASRDADRLNTELEGKAATVVPGYTVTAKATPFDVTTRATTTRTRPTPASSWRPSSRT